MRLLPYTLCSPERFEMVRHRSQPSSVLRGLKARELRGLPPRSVLPADEATECAGGGDRVSICSERPRRTEKVLPWLAPAVLDEVVGNA